MTPKHASCYLILTGLSGCVIGPSPQPGLPNSMTAYIHNDAAGTMVGRGGFLHTYANARCESEKKQASNVSMANKEALTTIPVKQGVPLTFALTTLNSQPFKGNWGCSVTSTFTPVAGARYETVLQTENDNRTCKVTILDQDQHVVTATHSEYSCHNTMAGIVKNGQRYAPGAAPVPIYIAVPR